MCFSLFPAELFALQEYSPSSVLFTLLNVKSAVFFPELNIIPFLNQCTSGSGVPDAVQLIFTKDPSL